MMSMSALVKRVTLVRIASLVRVMQLPVQMAVSRNSLAELVLVSAFSRSLEINAKFHLATRLPVQTVGSVF